MSKINERRKYYLVTIRFELLMTFTTPQCFREESENNVTYLTAYYRDVSWWCMSIESPIFGAVGCFSDFEMLCTHTLPRSLAASRSDWSLVGGLG